ncbi:MAG: glycosyltransferase [Bacteroidota bacterium]
MPLHTYSSPPGERLRFSIIVPTYKRRQSLQRLVDSILRLNYPNDRFEVIVVNDGSTDDTAQYLDTVTDSGLLKTLTIPNSGPAVARNHGARIARGEFLVFVDDDCLVPSEWLHRIDRALGATNIHVVGGSVRNALTHNPYAVAYDANHQFFVGELNRSDQGASFLTTNNFTCNAAVFSELGGYDERFHVGGEDRELVSRLLAAGYQVKYDPSIQVDHYHDFHLRGFIQQYYRFGKGSYLLHSVIARERQIRTASLGPSGYLRLFLNIGNAYRLPRRAVILLLTIIAQMSAALGYIATSWEGLSDIPGEKRRIHSPDNLGVQGRIRELFTYLLGTILSSILGLLAFFMLGRSLSIEEYGVFTFAFSLTTFIQTLGAVGIASAITRQMVELIKTGDEQSRGALLKAAGALFGVVLIVLIAVLVFVWEPLLSQFQAVRDENVLPVLVLGTLGATAFEFFLSAYQIKFKLLRLALLRFVVSFLRVAVIFLMLVMGFRDPLHLYVAFFAPAWIGAIVAAAEFLKIGFLGGRVESSTISRLAAYSWWQTLSSATVILMQHAGALILVSTSWEGQVGLYGLGMTFSFMYGVVGAALGSYYVPIGARLRSHEDVREFLRRTNRINLPIMVIGILSLFVTAPLFEIIFGVSKQGAVPVFILLSLAAIMGIGTVAFHSLFHYFLKPRSITYAQALGVGAFSLTAVVLVEYGAVGMAAAYLTSRITLYLGLQLLIRNEFKQRGIVT